MTTAADKKDVNPIALARLVRDLKTAKTLCRVENYPDVTLEALNTYLRKHGPLPHPAFGDQAAFFIDDGYYTPYRMVVYGREIVVHEIAKKMGEWAKWTGGGRVTTPQGAFVVERTIDGDEPTVRMPDVAYVPRVVHRALTPAQIWTYRGEPFAPTFVVEVDTLSGNGSMRAALDRKMRNDYFPNGVQLGWLIDPHPDCRMMIEYYTDASGVVQRSADTTWRNLSGRDVLPGFELNCILVEMALNQESGSSEEVEEDVEELSCPMPRCGKRFRSTCPFLAHIEQHRCEKAIKKYLAKTATRANPSQNEEAATPKTSTPKKRTPTKQKAAKAGASGKVTASNNDA